VSCVCVCVCVCVCCDVRDKWSVNGLWDIGLCVLKIVEILVNALLLLLRVQVSTEGIEKKTLTCCPSYDNIDVRTITDLKLRSGCCGCWSTCIVSSKDNSTVSTVHVDHFR